MSARSVKTRLRVLGSGEALPGAPLSSENLLARLARNFQLPTRTGEMLARRLGVAWRHHSRDWLERLEAPRAGSRNPELAARALVDALAAAALPVARLQYLIGHTTTPAQLLPPNLTEVADRLGLAAPYVELRQACTGFANALQLAAGLLAAPGAPPLAIVGSEVGSPFLDPLTLATDPAQWVNLMQMGDGAGAIVLGPDDGSAGARLESLYFGHCGGGRPAGFMLADGGSDRPALAADRVAMSFSHDFEAVRREGTALFRAGLDAALDAGVNLAALAWIIPHQANAHIGDWLARALNLPAERFYGNAEHVGNLGSASIWVALHELRTSGRLKAGDRVLALGAEATQYLYGGFVYVHG